MAYDYFQQQQEEEKDKQGQPRPLGQSGGLIEGTTPQSAQQDGGTKKTSSSAFTNLNAYLDANKDQNFGQQVAGRVGSTIHEAELAQNQNEAAFRKSVDEGAVDQDKNLIDEVSYSPDRVASDDKKAASFEKMREAYYKGPNSFSERADLYQPAQQKTDSAYLAAKEARDETGRKAYLQQEYGAKQGRHGYTKGQTKLDNLLIQQDPSARDKFEAHYAKAGQVKDRFGTLSQGLNQYAATRKADTDNTRLTARNTLGLDDAKNWKASGAVPDTITQLDKQLGQRRAQGAQEYASYAPASGSTGYGDIDLETGKKMGLVKEGQLGIRLPEVDIAEAMGNSQYGRYGAAGGQFYGIDPQSFVSQVNLANLNHGNVATPEQAARLKALQKLAGKDVGVNLDEASKYASGPLANFDRSSFLSAVNRKKQEFQDELNRAIQANHNLTAGGNDNYGVFQGNLNDQIAGIMNAYRIKDRVIAPPRKNGQIL